MSYAYKLHYSRYCFSIAILLAANFGSVLSLQNHATDCFQAFGHHPLDWLCCSIGTWEYTITPLFWTGCWCRSAALHKIWLWTCGFALCLLFPQKSMNDGKIELSEESSFGLTSSSEIYWNFISHENKISSHSPKFTNHQNLFDSRKVCAARVAARFPEPSLLLLTVTAADY